MSESRTSIIKKLSANDLGLTGGHQSGIVIPKQGEILETLPYLDVETINPFVVIRGYDPVFDKDYNLRYIYYNGKLHGTSTRNEYRITGISAFLKNHAARVEDNLVIQKRRTNFYTLKIETNERESLVINRTITIIRNWSLRRN